MITLGLDVSTSCIGWCVLKDNNYLDCGYLSLKKYNNLYEKLDCFRSFFLEFQKKYIREDIFIVVEEPVKMFMSNKSMAQVISILQRFNGFICSSIYIDTGILPELINVSTARKNCGIKISKGQNAKQQVLTYVKENGILHEDKWEFKKTGKPKDYMFDICDAYVVAKGWTERIKK